MGEMLRVWFQLTDDLFIPVHTQSCLRVKVIWTLRYCTVLHNNLRGLTRTVLVEPHVLNQRQVLYPDALHCLKGEEQKEQEHRPDTKAVLWRAQNSMLW